MADKGLVAEFYSEEAFWEKLRTDAAIAGADLVNKALVLYCAMRCPKAPVRIKVAIMGALGYFILPLDAIPDTLAGIGYLDDLGVLAWAYDTTLKHIGSDAVENAARISRKWFDPERGRRSENGATVVLAALSSADRVAAS